MLALGRSNRVQRQLLLPKCQRRERKATVIVLQVKGSKNAIGLERACVLLLLQVLTMKSMAMKSSMLHLLLLNTGLKLNK